MSRWLVIAVLAAPLAVFPAAWGINGFQAKNAVFIVLGLGVVLWLVESWALRAFCGWAVVCFASSGARAWGLAGLLGILAWALVFHGASRLTAREWRSVRHALTGAALFQVAWMSLQAMKLDPLFSPLSYHGEVMAGHVRPLGWFANPTDTALFLGLSLPALPLVAAAVVAVAIVVWVPSTSGLVGVALTGAWWGWRALPRPWKPLAPAALVGAALAVPWLDPGGFGGRIPVWQSLAHFAWASPVVGWGPNALGYKVMVLSAQNERWEFGFNEYLQGAMELGLVGLVLALAFVGLLVWRARLPLEAPAIGLGILLVTAAFSIPLRIGPVALVAALYCGRLAALPQEA